MPDIQHFFQICQICTVQPLHCIGIHQIEACCPAFVALAFSLARTHHYHTTIPFGQYVGQLGKSKRSIGFCIPLLLGKRGNSNEKFAYTRSGSLDLRAAIHASHQHSSVPLDIHTLHRAVRMLTKMSCPVHMLIVYSCSNPNFCTSLGST